MNEAPLFIPQDDPSENFGVPARQIRNAFRIIFWGILLAGIDIPISDLEVQLSPKWTLHLDNLYHIVGAAMIIRGLSTLIKVVINKAYYISMMFCFCISILLTLSVISNIFTFPPFAGQSIIEKILFVVHLLGVLIFCFSMRQLSIHYELITSEEKWTSCLNQFVVTYAVLFLSLLIFLTINLITNGTFKLPTTGSPKYLSLGILIPLSVYIFFLHIFFMLCLLNSADQFLVRAKKEELGIQGDWKV